MGKEFVERLFFLCKTLINQINSHFNCIHTRSSLQEVLSNAIKHSKVSYPYETLDANFKQKTVQHKHKKNHQNKNTCLWDNLREKENLTPHLFQIGNLNTKLLLSQFNAPSIICLD